MRPSSEYLPVPEGRSELIPQCLNVFPAGVGPVRWQPSDSGSTPSTRPSASFQTNRGCDTETVRLHRLDQEPVPVRPNVEGIIDRAQNVSFGLANPGIHQLAIAELHLIVDHPTMPLSEEVPGANGRMIVDDDDLISAGRISPDAFEETGFTPESVVNRDDDTGYQSQILLMGSHRIFIPCLSPKAPPQYGPVKLRVYPTRRSRLKPSPLCHSLSHHFWMRATEFLHDFIVGIGKRVLGKQLGLLGRRRVPVVASNLVAELVEQHFTRLDPAVMVDRGTARSHIIAMPRPQVTAVFLQAKPDCVPEGHDGSIISYNPHSPMIAPGINTSVISVKMKIPKGDSQDRLIR